MIGGGATERRKAAFFDLTERKDYLEVYEEVCKKPKQERVIRYINQINPKVLKEALKNPTGELELEIDEAELLTVSKGLM